MSLPQLFQTLIFVMFQTGQVALNLRVGRLVHPPWWPVADVRLDRRPRGRSASSGPEGTAPYVDWGPKSWENCENFYRKPMETTIFQIQRIFCSLVSYVSCENRSFPADFRLNRSSEKMVKSEESIKKIAICPVSIFCYAGAWPWRFAKRLRRRVRVTCSVCKTGKWMPNSTWSAGCKRGVFRWISEY